MAFPLIKRSTYDALVSRYSSMEQEYQNYRRRNAETERQSYEKGGSDTVKQLLPVYDNLFRALEQPTEDEAFRKGIEMTMTTLKKSLSDMGVEEIAALGERFDPELHEAADHVEDPEADEAQVVRVMLTGFRRGNKVIRHALVVVAN